MERFQTRQVSAPGGFFTLSKTMRLTSPRLMAFGGMMSVTGRPQDPPTFCGASINDKATGLFCAVGALAGLRQRDRTGRGCLIDTSLLETAAFWVEGQVNQHLATGDVPTRHGTGAAVIVPYQVFETADRPLCLAAGNDRLFARAAKVLGLPINIDRARPWSPRRAPALGEHTAEVLAALKR